MRRSATLSMVLGLAVLLIAGEAFARGGRGGGGRGGRVGGGGSFGGGRSPSMSRPSARPSISRPSVGGGGSRPSIGGGSRPSVGGGSRPSVGGGSRPSVGGGSRPSVGGGSRPSVGGGSRPSVGGGSRPSIGTLPSTPGGSRPGSGSRPSQGQLQDFLQLPGRPSTLPAGPGTGGDRPGIGGGDRPGIGGGDRPGIGGGDRPDIGGGDRPGIGGGDRPGIGGGDRPGGGNRPGIGPGKRPPGNIYINRPQNITSIRNKWNNVANRPFTSNWWRTHGGLEARHWRWHRYWHTRPAYWWWRPCTWTAVTGWFASWFNRPYYFDYGTNVYYQDNSVYYGDTLYASADEYYNQAVQIADAAPEVEDEEKVEWMPLGVWALSDEQSTASNMVLQLAVSKEGIIAGTLFNETTGATRPVEGSVDKQSQRAAWSLADDGPNQDVVMETGIYNLTKNEAQALVHFGKEKAQTWLMVRLEQPAGEDAGGGEQPAPNNNP